MYVCVYRYIVTEILNLQFKFNLINLRSKECISSDKMAVHVSTLGVALSVSGSANNGILATGAENFLTYVVLRSGTPIPSPTRISHFWFERVQ